MCLYDILLTYYRGYDILSILKGEKMKIPIRERKYFGLIGYPLAHSISPFIHKELFKRSGIVGDYDLIEVERGSIYSVYENDLILLDGFNVTIPYKVDILPLLDRLSSRAKIFGSVNTVGIKDMKATGYNTDCIGFIKALGYGKMDLAGSVLVLGCGGVSRMFAYECAIAGAELTIAVRKTSIEKAKTLSKEIEEKLKYPSKVVALDELEQGYDMILNGTPVGMYPNVDECPVSEEIIKRSKAVFDAIYNPEETKLISFAKKHGLKYINGLPMLVWQAAAAEEIWNEIKFSNEDVDEVIERAKEYLKNE